MGLLDWIFGEEREKLIFTSFAIEDASYRTHLVKQAKRESSPFSFIDMSAKKAWKESEWQKRCRTKIKKCDGVIVLLSNNTYHASGVRWEIKCAKEEGIPIIGMHVKKNDKKAIPPELKGTKIIIWNWKNLETFINKL